MLEDLKTGLHMCLPEQGDLVSCREISIQSQISELSN